MTHSPILHAAVRPFSKSYHFDEGDEFLFEVESTQHDFRLYCVRDDTHSRWIVKEAGFPIIDLPELQSSPEKIRELHSVVHEQGVVKDDSLLVTQSVDEFIPDEIIPQLPTLSSDRGSDRLKIPFKILLGSYTDSVCPLLFEEPPTEMTGSYYLQTDPYIRFQKLHRIEEKVNEERSAVTQKEFELSESFLAMAEKSFQSKVIE